MSLLETVYEFNKLASQDMVAAIDTYYADDIELIEATGEVVHGAAAQKERTEKWQSSISEIHGGVVHAVCVNEETGHAMIESWIEATFHDMGRMKMEEVAVQTWKDGRVIRERFYYNAAGMEQPADTE